MSVHSLDISHRPQDYASSPIPQDKHMNRHGQKIAMADNAFSVSAIINKGKGYRPSGGPKTTAGHIPSVPTMVSPVVTSRRRPGNSYISVFDDKFKVDLNTENSPSVSAYSQRSIDFSGRVLNIQDRVIGVILILIALIMFTVNVLLDVGVLSLSTHFYLQYFDEFPFILILFLVFLFFTRIALKIFKHN